MQEYDINKLKRNVKRLMEERGIKQKELEEGTKVGDTPIIRQSQISKILAGDNSNCFTLSQIIAIAEYFKVSVDELLGLNEEKQAPQYETLSDIASALFAMARSNTGLTIGVVSVDVEIMDEISGYPRCAKGNKSAIYFENDTIDKLIREWSEIHNLHGVSCKDKLLNLWENEQLEKGKEKKVIYNYQSVIDYVREIFDGYYNRMQKQNIEHAISKTDFNALVQYRDLFHAFEPIDFNDNIIFHIDEVIEFYKDYILPF